MNSPRMKEPGKGAIDNRRSYQARLQYLKGDDEDVGELSNLGRKICLIADESLPTTS